MLDDDVVELTETVTVSLLGTNNAGATIDPVNDTATVTIADDDTGTVSIAGSMTAPRPLRLRPASSA